MQKFKSNLKFLFDEVDIASIVIFRIFFGGIMLWEVIRYFQNDWIYEYWIETEYHFPYWPFLSLEPLADDGMYYLFYALGALAIFIILGLFYRISIFLFFLGFTYMFLLEQTRYLNHFYFVSIVSFIMCFIPASRSLSLDALFFKKMKKSYVSKWHLWLLRFMIAVPLFFGGVAKINPDWLVGEPLGMWLAHDTDFPIIGKYFNEKWMILLMSYSGMFLDLFIVPFLLIRRTRIWAFIFGTLFHLMNSELFVIGIFPWFMMAATTLFFDPEWPRTLINKLSKKGVWIQNKILEPFNSELNTKKKIICIAIGVWVFIMCFMPFRHLLIPGNVHWTEDGHKYAWHMKLRSKRASGLFYIKNKNGEVMNIIDMHELLPSWQSRKAIARPPMIWQFANYIKDEYKANGQDVSVYADIEASLNGRHYQQYTDPTVDLTAIPFPVWRTDWVVPLNTPLIIDHYDNDDNDEIDEMDD